MLFVEKEEKVLNVLSPIHLAMKNIKKIDYADIVEKKTEIGALWEAHVCGSCSNKVGPYVCYYCRDKIEIDD